MENREFHIEDAHVYNRSGPVRWMVSHVLRYPWLPLGVLAASLINNLAYGGIQVFVGKGFDRIITPGWTRAELGVLAFGVMGAAVIQGLMALARNFGVEFLAQRVERDAREELYVSLLGKSQTFHGRQRIGDIMARATNDVRNINFMFSPGLMLITDAAMSLVVPLVLIGFIQVDLLLVPLLFEVGLAMTVWDYNRRLKPVSMEIREAFGRLNAGLTESVTGIQVVKANAREGFERRRFMDDARGYRNLFVEQGDIQARYLPMLVFSVAWGAALFHGLWMWRAGAVSLGEVVAFMGLVETLRFPTFISIFSFNLVQLGIAGAERILELINTRTELDQNMGGLAAATVGRVTFEHVSFSYNGKPVLEDISFEAAPGQTIAIVGQTGSGKTTLTRLINRIYDCDSGRVRVDGTDVRDWSLETLRAGISSIDQDVFLFSSSLTENIAFGRPDAEPEAVRAAAEQAQAHAFIMDFPDQYDTVVGERGVTLSGGQRQRIAIARAFLTQPRILILDDSTSAIDSATEDQIQRAMRHVARNRTTFIITHRLSQIRWADRILVLRRGRLVDQGTHEELHERSPEYQRIFARYE
jgi:ATP-binding cassette subfamily B protein